MRNPFLSVNRLLAAAVALIFGACFLFFTVAQPGSAEPNTAACPTIVSAAMDATNTLCAKTGRNQICYGNNLVNAEPQANVTRLNFNVPGDTVPVTRVRSIRGSTLDIDSATWGVALMRVQANLPEALPNQNLTFLLFGDAQIMPSSTRDMATVSMIAGGIVNVRSAPSLSAPILTTIARGQTVVVNGRITDNSWLRIWLPGEDGRTGWVFGSLLYAPSGDINFLNVIDPSAGEPTLGAMDAFYLSTGKDGVACNQVPENGLLIQTPEGAGTVRLYINEVKVDIGSTVFIQSQPGAQMTISTLEGSAHVESDNHSETAIAGSEVTIPLADNSSPAGPPDMPKPYQAEPLKALPVTSLERPIEVAPPLSEDTIETVHERTQENKPLCGLGQMPACGSITIDGIVEAIDGDTITVNGMKIKLAANSPLRKLLVVGTEIHLDGNLDSESNEIDSTKIVVVAPPASDDSNSGSGKGNSGMGGPGPSDPGMGGPSDPGMGNPGMGGPGDPGMGNPGNGGGDDHGNNGNGNGNGGDNGNSGMGNGGGDDHGNGNGNGGGNGNGNNGNGNGNGGGDGHGNGNGNGNGNNGNGNGNGGGDGHGNGGGDDHGNGNGGGNGNSGMGNGGDNGMGMGDSGMGMGMGMGMGG